MSTLTTNYALRKDAGTEQYDVSVVNANLDTIDAAMKAIDVDKNNRVSALEADSGYLTVAMINAAVWDHVAGHTLRYRKIGKMVEISGAIQWKSGVHAGTTPCTIPVGYRPSIPQWCTSKAAFTGGNDAVSDFLLDSTTGNLSIPSTAYVQGSPVVNILYPLHFSYFIP